jgi:uncharacterized protein (DUF1015 family)
MAEVQPFRGIRYHLDRPEAAEAVIAPPYDVISPAQQATLLSSSPHNVVRLELPEDHPTDSQTENRYTRAAALYRQWLSEGALARDEAPSLYIYGQRYETAAGVQERLGLLGALRVEPFEAGVVLPHEQTFPKHKEDRYQMLCAARAQFSPIFGLYSAPDAGVRSVLDRATREAPAAVARDPEGVMHRLWPVADPEFAAWAAELFAGRQVFIADGHHRYETALRYRNEQHSAGIVDSAADYVMTFLVEMEDPGLVLLPTHRLVRGRLPETGALGTSLSAYFEIEEVPSAEVDRLEHHQIGLVLPGGEAWRLRLRDSGALDRLDTEHSAAWRDLDVVLLHRLIFREVLRLDEHEAIVYTRSTDEARERATKGEFAAAFLLPSPKVQELKDVAGAGDRMPEKSTYFWPKAVTGLVLYSHEG